MSRILLDTSAYSAIFRAQADRPVDAGGDEISLNAEETSEFYAVIADGLRSAGTPIPTNDIWIAPSAMQYGLQLVTKDQHFRKVREVLVEYFDPAAG